MGGERRRTSKGGCLVKGRTNAKMEVLKWESEQVQKSAQSKVDENRRAEVSKVTWKLTAFGWTRGGEGGGRGGLFGGAQSD